MNINMSKLSLIAITRVFAGVGLGFLMADSLSVEQRRAVGWTLFVTGVVTSIPIAMELFGGLRTPLKPVEQQAA